ncbi:MAG: universal stress protein [Burkholderiales bacterium]
MNLLIPIDGSVHSENAVRHALTLRKYMPVEIHLLNVQPGLHSGHAKMFVSEKQLQNYQREHADQALQSARALLDTAEAPYQHHIGVGSPGETIVAFAKEKHCDQIIMGARGENALTKLILGSVATEVIGLAEIPVTLVK